MIEKLFIETSNLNVINSYKKKAVFIIEDLSLIKSLDKDVQIALKLEKIYDDEMLDNIDEAIFKRIKYIFYSDLGIYHKYHDKYLHSIRFVYHAPTYLTNYHDVNYFNRINYFVVVSNEISSDELIKIVNRNSKKVGIDLFGLSPIFYSRRLLLTNYFNYKGLKLDPKDNNYFIREETRNNKQRIVEDENSTIIYDDEYYHLDEELNDLKNNFYGIIHLNYLDEGTQLYIIDYYLNLSSHLIVSPLEGNNIKIGKGAYQNKSVLLKGDVENE